MHASSSKPYRADVTVTDGRIHIRRWCSLPRFWLAHSRLLRRWVCAGLLTLRWVLATWGAWGFPLRLGVYRTLRRWSRFLQ